MSDLLGGIFVNLLLSAVLLAVAQRLAKRAKAPVIGAAVLLLICALGWYLTIASDSLRFVSLLPTTSVFTLSDLTLPFCALLAGILVARLPKPRNRLYAGVLLALGLCHVIRPLLGATPATRGTKPVQEIYLQTSDASCSAASAASLLLAHGISANETEMTRLCVTRENGTSMLGAYRGLLLKTHGTGWHVATLTGGTLDGLRTVAAHSGPLLLSVGLPRFSLHPIDPRYERDWGWTPGLRHAVLLFGFLPDGKLDMGDPSVGREYWDVESLNVLWNGEAIYLVK